MSSRLANILGLPPVQPLLPRRPETERPLLAVLIIMAFLATLALLAGRQGLRLGAQWQGELYGTASLQVYNVAPENRDIISSRVQERLENFNPPLNAVLLSQTDMSERLKPWLGSASDAQDLPFPLFFALDSQSDIKAEQIKNWLNPLELKIDIDDHDQSRREFETLGRALYQTAFLVLGLVLTASAVIAGFATQSVMSAFKSTLNVIYRSGASRKFVTQIFIVRFFKLALRGALIGVGGAILVALLWNSIILRSNESLLQRLSLKFADIIWIAALIFIFALCCTAVSAFIAWRAPQKWLRKS